MRNSECGIKDGATVPHTVARREAPLSEYGGRSYRSAINTAQLPRPLWFMAGAANAAMRIPPDGGRRAVFALHFNIWWSANKFRRVCSEPPQR